ncbi:MAG: hypothetical protein P4L46_06430 [Fimbriimonas sp.]|nr:hypothetical protein [Fimbriimonas sp.]
MDPQRDFVATDKVAYLIFPATFVCGPKVMQMDWSVDGEHLAVMRKEMQIGPDLVKDILLQHDDVRSLPESLDQIVVWSAVTHKTTTVFAVKESQGSINEMQWLTGSSQLLVVATLVTPNDPNRQRTSLFRIQTNGTVVPLAPISQLVRYEVSVSPYRPEAAYIEYPLQNQRSEAQIADTPSPVRSSAEDIGTIRFVNSTGGLGPSVSMPGANDSLFWSKNGQIYALGFTRDPVTKRSKRLWYMYNRSTRKFESSTTPPDSAEVRHEELSPEIVAESLRPKMSVKKVGVNAPTVILEAFEAKDAEPAIVSTDGSDGTLSPKLNAVSYETQGSVMVREMVKVPLEAYKNARLAAIRTKLINQAKQVALGLIMYAGDYDDNGLSNQGNWQSQLEPYLRDTSLTDGFNYTFGGGNMGNIADPANTIMGYIEGPGGRAVAYADGHVRWIPNP